VLLRLSRGLSDILLMWDRRVLEKIKEYMREFYVACSFKKIEDLSFYRGLWAQLR
jgi:reverse gyrase